MGHPDRLERWRSRTRGPSSDEQSWFGSRSEALGYSQTHMIHVVYRNCDVPAVCVAVAVDVALAGAAGSRTLENIFVHGEN